MNPSPDAITLSAPMMRKYLSYVTVGYFDQRDAPPPLLEGYAECVRDAGAAAERSGDLPWFILGLQHLLQNPGIDTRGFNPDGFSYSDEDLREIIGYMVLQLAPGGAPAAAATDARAARVGFAELSPADWRSLRASLPQG